MIEKMKEMLEVQGQSGNWDYDEYMFGMYNGMELMLSIAEKRDPTYKERPSHWKNERIEELERKIEFLRDQVEFLNCLEACGVDNWSGYGYAREMMDEE